MTETGRGTMYAAGAYLMWGLLPLYWPLLEPSKPAEVLAHRIFWSLLAIAVLLRTTRRLGHVRAAISDSRRLANLVAAAILLSINWFTYIYAVHHDHVVEVSLGYFVNPILTVLLGVIVLSERLRPLQWGAVGAAAVAVVVLTVESGRPPWIALILAFSFGFYALLKKTAGVGAIEGLAVETAIVAPVAAGYLIVLAFTGDLVFGTEGPGHAALAIGAGVATALPLLFFGAAASRVPLYTIGIMQYLAPTLQFLIGVTVFDEPLPLAKLLGFTVVWTAVAVFMFDVIRERRRQLRLAVTAPA